MASNPYKDLLKTIQAKEKAKTPGEEFVADINRYFQVSKESYVPSKSVKPSGLGGCFRMQYYVLQGADRDVGSLEKAENITIQCCGNDAHDRLQNACQDAKRFGIDITWCEPEIEARRAYQSGIKTIIKRRDGNELLCYNEDYRASFKCDGIILFQDKKYIFEVKTEEYYKFNCRVAPEPKHVYQAGMYCLCFGIDRVMFLYEDRNLTFRKAYAVEITQELKDGIIDRIHHILAYSDAKKLPPKEKDKCLYCSYKQLCKKSGNTEAFSLVELREIIANEQPEKDRE